MKWSVAIACASVLGLCGTPLRAEDNVETYKKYAVPGKELVIDDFIDLNADCSNIGFATVRSLSEVKGAFESVKARPFRTSKRTMPASPATSAGLRQ